MKNVLLVKLANYINTSTPPLGIGYLLKAIQSIEGIKPIFIDCHRENMKEEEILLKIKQLNPVLIGFTIFSVDYAAITNLIPKIKNICPSTKIIVGGPHASGLPEYTLTENPDIDFLVKGEGEVALNKVVNNIINSANKPDVADIPNLVYRENGKIKTNRSEYVDVDKYGAPAWDLMEPDKYPAVQHGTFHKSTKVVPILTSRGCPYPCTFCAGHITAGKKVRRRSAADIADEIEFLQSKYGFKEFIIEDENFTYYKDHVLSLSNEIERRDIKCYFSFPSGIRLDRIDEEIVLHLRKMGTYMATFGIESGSEKTLKAMKKNWDLQLVKERIKLLKENGIMVLGSFILGFSNETMKDIQETVDYAINCGVDTAYFGNYMPLPGSEDFERMVRCGEMKLEEIDWSSYTSYLGKIPYHPPNISEKDLLAAIRKATFRFYMRPRVIFSFIQRLSHPIFLKSLAFRAFMMLK